ncbi:MAG: NYN domain-containing protein [Chloroflexota bacterium]
MSKNVAVFVDVANLYYSARGLEVDVDYVALLKAATKGRDLIRAYAYSGLDPENENQRKFIDFLGKNDYKVVHKDIRKFGDGRVKANLDIELVVDLFRLADRMDIAVIVSGDGDFAPAIRALQDKGVRCEVISFRPNTSSDLIAVADEFIDIMKIIGIGRGKDADKASKVMSAPPMPAKEVVPEFGFREAPAAVAAAALAAIRDGGAKPAARGRGRGRARPEPAAVENMAPGTEEPPEPIAAAAEGGTEAATGEAHRRRRRRGGRGRGRGRGRTEEAAEAATAPTTREGEVAWTELDDISQVGANDAEESRAYTFEEADAATLAELGLLPAADEPAVVPAAAESAVAPVAEAPKPRRGRTGARTPAKETVETDTATSEAPKPRRSRGRSGAAAASDVSAAADAPKPRRRTAKASGDAPAPVDEAAKPRARSRTKPAPSSASAPDASEGGEEGIWQRFRSARTKAT